MRDLAAVAAAAVLLACGLTHGVTYVRGGSMEPTLYRGDVIVYAYGKGAPAPGELVVWADDRGLVVHRVEGVMPDGSLTTCGDANRAPDALPVAPSQVRGRVMWVLPAGRAVAWVADVLR